MEVRLGEWNYTWENGSVVGRMDVYLGELDYSWEN